MATVRMSHELQRARHWPQRRLGQPADASTPTLNPSKHKADMSGQRGRLKRRALRPALLALKALWRFGVDLGVAGARGLQNTVVGCRASMSRASLSAMAGATQTHAQRVGPIAGRRRPTSGLRIGARKAGGMAGGKRLAPSSTMSRSAGTFKADAGSLGGIEDGVGHFVGGAEPLAMRRPSL